MRAKSGAVVHHPALHALELSQDLICAFHAHATEIRDQVNAARVTSKLALCASSGLAPTQREHVTTVATPVGTHVVESIEAVRNAVVDLLLVGIGLGVRFADTLGDDLGKAVLVASVLAVRALHAGGVLEEIATVCAAHDVVEGLHGELVAVLLDDILLLLTNGAFTSKTDVEFALRVSLPREADG